MDLDIDNIQHMWTRLNVSNIWQGEGITNCFNPIIGHQLEKLVRVRDLSGSNIKKVYRWTIDLSDSIKLALRYGIDGIMTNHPERIVSILRDPEFAGIYRLANIYDNPFNKHTTFHSPKAQMHTGVRERVVTLIRDLRESVYYFVVELFHSLLLK